MLENDRTQPELAPAGAIQNRRGMDSEGWFEYLVRVYPHHTDYSGAVWHGTYLAWMEEARVESLRSLGIQYADWVAQGLELPVVELSLRYHRAVQMGSICGSQNADRCYRGCAAALGLRNSIG